VAQSFDAYEYVGVIAPGSVVALGLIAQWPELRALIRIDGFSIGDLGAVVLAAFVLGHLVQGAGNILETVLWAPFGGMPSRWVLKPGRLISKAQREALARRLPELIDQAVNLDEIRRSEMASLVSQIFSRVRSAGRADRIDAYNRTYGLMRGLTAAFLMLAVWLAATQWPELKYAGFALVAATLAWFRAWRFGRYYGRDLYVEFLNLPALTLPIAAN
jgi:hypothetical protein